MLSGDPETSTRLARGSPRDALLSSQGQLSGNTRSPVSVVLENRIRCQMPLQRRWGINWV